MFSYRLGSGHHPTSTLGSSSRAYSKFELLFYPKLASPNCIFYLTEWHHHLVAQARTKKSSWLFTLSQLLLAHTLLLYIHCVLLNWRWTEDKGCGYKEAMISVTLVIKKWSRKFTSANEVMKEHIILEVAHLIFISPNSLPTALVHIFTLSLLDDSNSLWNSLSSFFKFLNENSTWHSKLLYKTLLFTLFSPLEWPFSQSSSSISNVTSLSVPSFTSWNLLLHIPRSLYHFLSMKCDPL